MNTKFFLILFALSFNILAMEDDKTFTLAGPAHFSPSGKLLLVLEENDVTLHDTKTGKKLGILENISAKTCSQTSNFVFSPQETYLGFKNQIWTVADQKEHLKGVLKTENVKAWNKPETIFFTEVPAGRKWFIQDAFTALFLRSFSHQDEPSRFSASDMGALVSFTYPIGIPLFKDASEPRSQTAIHNIQSERGPLIINHGHHTTFFPDNTHALVATTKGEVCVVNAEWSFLMHVFVCANSLTSNTPCYITINNMKSIITHPSARDFFCTINCDGTAFSFQKHDKPADDPKLLSNTKQFRVKRVEKGSKLYLHHATDTSKEPQVLLDSVNAYEEDAIFVGDHDEHILVLTRPKIHLYILRVFSPHYLRKIQYRAITISPDKYSFVITTAEGNHILCILPSAAEILAKEKNSYFSLLPEDIRKYLRYLQTPEDNFAKVE